MSVVDNMDIELSGNPTNIDISLASPFADDACPVKNTTTWLVTVPLSGSSDDDSGSDEDSLSSSEPSSESGSENFDGGFNDFDLGFGNLELEQSDVSPGNLEYDDGFLDSHFESFKTEADEYDEDNAWDDETCKESASEDKTRKVDSHFHPPPC